MMMSCGVRACFPECSEELLQPGDRDIQFTMNFSALLNLVLPSHSHDHILDVLVVLASSFNTEVFASALCLMRCDLSVLLAPGLILAQLLIRHRCWGPGEISR